jgi:predicted nicotinamide N-methyase
MTTENGIGPIFVETPPGAIPEIVRENVIVEGQAILIDRPTNSDDVLDDPSIREANVKDGYMPYWTDIWPAARMMAKAILREPWEQFPLRSDVPLVALELGCGLGVAGLAALKRGLHVIFSDYDLTALKFAERNARLNGFSNFRTMPIDWRCPPSDLRVPLIIAADLTYEVRNIDPLLALIKKLLLPSGVCLLADPDRPSAPRFRERLAEENFSYSTQFVRAGAPGRPREKGTLYRINSGQWSVASGQPEMSSTDH